MLQPLKWLSLIPSPADTHVEWSNRPVSDSIIKFHLGIWTMTIHTKMVTKVFLGSPEPWNCLCTLFIQLHHILYLWHSFLMGHIVVVTQRLHSMSVLHAGMCMHRTHCM